MIEMLRNVLEAAGGRFQYHITTFLPPLLVALTIIAGAWITAVLARWVLFRIFKFPTIDKFLRQSGVAFMIDPSGRLRATRLVAGTVYWVLLLSGLLIGLSVFDSDLTTQMVQGFVFLLPKLVVAGLILLSGAWLSRYLGRSLLVWAVNEDLPYPRRLAALARVLIMFVAIVVAADYLNFARNVFLAAFIILSGGAVLAGSLAVAMAGAARLRRMFGERREETEDSRERSLWEHL
jgi:hypothetical protein